MTLSRSSCSICRCSTSSATRLRGRRAGLAPRVLLAALALAGARAYLQVDAVGCVGVFSYVERFDVLFPELSRVLRPGGVFVTTHRRSLWDNDERGCRTAASTLTTWRIEAIGEPEPYMPKNPDPVERAKLIRLLSFRKL